jgi:hypothetical protein
MIIATFNVNGRNGRLPKLLSRLAERQPTHMRAAYSDFPGRTGPMRCTPFSPTSKM